ncbi:MAG: PAS domain-containing protein, partial [Raoultibacter sp.]
PIRLDYASPALCEMIGYSQEELRDNLHDRYTALLHEDDAESFRKFVLELSKEKKTLTLRYRMVHKDGHILHVSDTMSSRIMTEAEADGHILLMNKHFLKMLGAAEVAAMSCEEVKYMATLTSLRSIRALAEDATGPDPDTPGLKNRQGFLRKFDGVFTEVAGWSSAFRTEEGTVLCRLVCTELPGQDNLERKQGIETFIETARHAFDAIFIFDKPLGSLRCIQNSSLPEVQGLGSVSAMMPSALDFLLDSLVAGKDQQNVRALFEEVLDQRKAFGDGAVSRICFELARSRGAQKCDGLLMGFGDKILFLCKKIAVDLTPAQPRGSAPCFLDKDIYIQTFGHFRVLVDGRPVAFNHAKSEELLALLVDNRGGYVSSAEAVSFLWEGETANKVTLSRFRKIAMRLGEILEEYGIADIVEKSGRSRRIETDLVRCDLFDYLSGDEKSKNLFKGSYLREYSWGEVTLAELSFRAMDFE